MEHDSRTAALTQFHVLSRGRDAGPVGHSVGVPDRRQRARQVGAAGRVDVCAVGRADEFARKPAGERKQVLGDILGLAAYDAYEQKTRERVRLLEDETLRLQSEVAAIEHELKEKPQREAELARCEREFVQVDAKL